MRLGEVVRWIHLFLIVLRRKPFRPQNTMQVNFSSPMAEAAVKRHLESATYISTSDHLMARNQPEDPNEGGWYREHGASLAVTEPLAALRSMRG